MSTHNVVGQVGIEDKETAVRNASVLAIKDTYALMLTKKDYSRIFHSYQVNQKVKQNQFLDSLAFFAELPRVKLSDLNNNLFSEQKFSQGDRIYDIGQPSNVFYIVREGKLSMETVMEIDDVFKAPATHREWTVRTRTRRI